MTRLDMLKRVYTVCGFGFKKTLTNQRQMNLLAVLLLAWISTESGTSCRYPCRSSRKASPHRSLDGDVWTAFTRGASTKTLYERNTWKTCETQQYKLNIQDISKENMEKVQVTRRRPAAMLPCVTSEKTGVVDDFLQDRRHEPLPNNCSQRSEESF